MPQAFGLMVKVHSIGKSLPEFGIQRLNAINTVSAYIESEPNAEFCLSVQPQLSWSSRLWDGADSAVATSKHDTRQDSKAQPADIDGIHSSQLPSKGSNSSNASQNRVLVAELYLDGQETPEELSIIYPENHESAPNDGVTWINRSWISKAQGSQAFRWVFKERAIESLLGLVDLNVETSQDLSDEKILTVAFPKLLIDESVGEETPKLGEIAVVFYRATIGPSYLERNSSQSRSALGDEKLRDEALQEKFRNKELDHVIATEATGVTEADTNVVDIYPLEPHAKVWAKFKFRYRSKAQLAKLDLGGFGNPESPVHSRRKLNTTLMDFTPLSFQMKPESKPEKDSGESSDDKGRKRLYSSPDMDGGMLEQNLHSTTKVQKTMSLAFRGRSIQVPGQADKLQTSSSEELRRSQRLQDRRDQAKPIPSSSVPPNALECTNHDFKDDTRTDETGSRSVRSRQKGDRGPVRKDTFEDKKKET